MTRTHSILPTVLLGFLLAFSPTGLMGGFSLLGEKSDSNSMAFTLQFTEKPSEEVKEGGHFQGAFGQLPEFEEFGDPDWRSPLQGAGKTSALLAIPGSREAKSDQWTLHVEGNGKLPPAAFAVNVVQVGPFTALHVIADRDLIPPGVWGLSIEGDGGWEKSEARKVSPEENSITRGLFLNGDQLVSIRPANEKSSLPEPPAPYRLRYREGNRLARIALPDGASPDNIRLTHHGEEIAWLPDSLLVWLPARQNILTDRHGVVFLDASSQHTSLVMNERDAFETLSPLSQEVAKERSKVYRPRLVYERATPMEIGDRFVQYRVARGQTRNSDYAFNDRLSSPTVTATVRVAGLNTLAAFDPDHYALFSLGGVSGGPEVAWNGRTVIDHTFTVDLDPSSFSGGEAQTIQFSHQVPVVPDGPNPDLQNLDSVHMEWHGYPRVGAEGTLFLELPESPGSLPRRVTVGGLPVGTTVEDIHLLDVTNPAAPTVLTSSSWTSRERLPLSGRLPHWQGVSLSAWRTPLVHR